MKEAACTAVSIFNLCDDTSSSSKDVEDNLQTQKETIATLQRVQSVNDENFFQLGNEVRATQENVQNLRDEVNDRLQTLDVVKNVPKHKRNIPASSKRLICHLPFGYS